MRSLQRENGDPEDAYIDPEEKYDINTLELIEIT
jgi:hypothetical protein